MYVITHVGVWSWAKVSALLSSTGVLLSIPFSLLSSGMFFGSTSFVSSIGFGTLISLVVGVFGGMAVGALAAVIYNWLAPHIGFFAMDIELEAEDPPGQEPSAVDQPTAPPPAA